MSECPAGGRLADAHHHLWDLRLLRYPWLQGRDEDPLDASGVGSLQRDYLATDFLADTAGVALLASVHVEAAAAPDDALAETRWLQQVADEHGFPHGIVAAALLERADAAEALRAHLVSPNVRGVRQMLDRNPRTGASEPTALLGDPAWRRGFALLAGLGLSFDLQILPSQLAAAADLADDFPETTIILNHAGYHVPGSASMDAYWRAGLAVLARHQNVVVKSSGYDTVDPSWLPEGFAQYQDVLFTLFGTERVLFASNFPVDRRTISYSRLLDMHRRSVTGLTADEQDGYFYANAARVYRLADSASEAPATSAIPWSADEPSITLNR